MPRPIVDLPFTAPWLLAPMEGVTDRVYRGLVLARNGPDALGGAFTEFLRVLARPRGVAELRRHLEGSGHGRPVGVQLMGSDLDALAGSAIGAVEVGAPLVDLNFGCPAKGALRGCAGSALLRDPAAVEEVVRVVCAAVDGAVPVSAKIRAGYDDAERVEDLARAAEQGGASLLTVHARTRAEGYQPHVDWARIARAVGAVSIPVCGNGGVRAHDDLARMRAETGCALVMVGQAALADPWIFSGSAVGRPEAARFLVEYAAAMRANGATERGASARVKQLLRTWRAGRLVADEEQRVALLRERDPEALLAHLRQLTGAASNTVTTSTEPTA